MAHEKVEHEFTAREDRHKAAHAIQYDCSEPGCNIQTRIYSKLDVALAEQEWENLHSEL